MTLWLTLALPMVVALFAACVAGPAPSVKSSPRPTALAPSALSPWMQPTEDVRSPDESPAFGAGLTCSGDRWPPADLSGVAGIRAVSVDRATVEIANDTDRLWYYTLQAWEVATLESCVGLIATEIERGPLAPTAIVRTSLGVMLDRPDLPVTIAFWDGPCGEACFREPQHPMLIERSLVEPGSS